MDRDKELSLYKLIDELKIQLATIQAENEKLKVENQKLRLNLRLADTYV